MNFQLPIKKILVASILIAWVRRREYFDALAVPTLLLVLTWALSVVLTERLGAFTGWFLLPLYAVAFVLFAVTCHRFILVDGGRATRKHIAIGRRELQFFGWMIGIYLIVAILNAAGALVLVNIHSVNTAQGGGPSYWMERIASIPAYYVLGRLSLVFPATAIGSQASLKGSWRKTRSNGWRMFVIVGLFPWLISGAIWLIWREGATVLEQAMLTLLSYVGISVQIFALSFSYREFGKQSL